MGHRPAPAGVRRVDHGRPHHRQGTGRRLRDRELTLLVTGRGLEVLGLDASAPAIDQARVKAQARGLGTPFMVGDALDLPSLGEALDTILDSGLLHILSDTDRARLVEGLHAVLRPGGVYDLLCFSERASIPGPRRLTQAELRAAFGPGWQVEGIQGARFEVLGDLPGADAWLATIRRRTSTSRSRRS